MTGVAEDVVDRPGLHDAAAVHHGDGVDEVPHDAEVVAHVDDRDVALLAEARDHVDQPVLGEHVQAGRRLVHHDHLRLADESHRDGDTLLLAAAELMGIASEHLRV